MTDVLRIKRRALGGAAGAPGSLAVGELAFNEVDGGLYIGRSNGSVVQINNPLGGILTYVDTTHLKFAPYGGNYIRINGILYPIPAAGIAGLTTTGVYVNGVAGQNLVLNTNYLICVFNNSGVLTADFRSGATHATSTTAGNEGTEILTGDDTRSLIGMCRPATSTLFYDNVDARYVRSWFNAPTLQFRGVAVSVSGFAGTSDFGSLGGSANFLAWANERADIGFNAICWNTSATQSVYTCIELDQTTGGGSNGCLGYHTSSTASAFGSVAPFFSTILTEGLHFTQGGAFVSGGAGTVQNGYVHGTLYRQPGTT
jgi:hypothetical protein